MGTPTVGPDQGSVPGWINALKLGDDAAPGALWARHFDELVRLVRGRLRTASRAAAVEEDVARSAFHSLCAGVTEGRFGRLGGRDDLWRPLATITLRKAFDRQVALSRMEGFTGDQIAERLGCIRRTVTRKLDLIGEKWLEPESPS